MVCDNGRFHHAQAVYQSLNEHRGHMRGSALGLVAICVAAPSACEPLANVDLHGLNTEGEPPGSPSPPKRMISRC